MGEPRLAPPLPIKENRIVPRARRPHLHWLTWTPFILLISAFVASFYTIAISFYPVMAVFIVLMLLSARRFAPARGAPVRRRLWLLALLPVPWLASFLGGPLPWQIATGDMPAIEDWMIPFQFSMLAAATVLPAVLIIALPGARRFTLMLGLLNLVLAFFLTSAGVITLSPGS